MRITHVCKVWYPRITGVTSHVDALATRMADKGHNVHVVTYDLAGSMTRKQPIHRETKDNYQVCFVRPGNEEDMVKGIETTDPQVIHAHGMWEHVPAAGKAAKKAKFFITAHGTWMFLYQTPGMESFSRRLRYRWYYWTGWRKLVRQADAMLALNRIEVAMHSRLGAQKVFQVPNGSDGEIFHPGKKGAPVPDVRLPEQYFLYAGSIQEQKGMFLLLEALKKFTTQAPPAFVVAGDGPGKKQAEKMVTEHRLPVTFAGRVKREHMPALMAKAKAFVLPSVNEPFATVYLEAMASGVCCVGTDTGGTPEIIDHDKTGRLIRKNDADGLYQTLAYLWENERKCREMGRAGREKMRKQFDWQILVPKILSIYEQRM